MQTKVFLSVGVALVSGFLLAGDGTMKSWADLEAESRNAGTSITNAVDYADPGNWMDGTVAGGTDATANFPETTVDAKRHDGLRFVIATNDLTLGKFFLEKSNSGIDALMTNRVCFVSDHAVMIANTEDDGAEASRHKSLAFAGRIYADITGPADRKDTWTDGHFELCGDYEDAGAVSKLSCGGGTMRLRMDLYANSADEVRENPLRINELYRSGGFVFYAPRGADEQVGQWSQTAGSPYLFRTGEEHPLAAGTRVSGAGIPEGAFLKRIFTDGSIELSAPVTSTAEGNSVTFAAFTPDVYQYLKSISRHSKVAENLGLVKFRPQDKLRVEVNNLANFRALTLVHTDTQYNPYGGKLYPGTLVIHAAHQITEPLRLGDCHLEFAENGYKNQVAYPYGIQNATLVSYGPDYVARLTVTNNLSAVCSMSNITSTVVKDGLGTLISGFNAELASNTGTLVVEEGLFVATSGVADATLSIGTLAISNGATFRLPPQGMTCRRLVVEPGAVLAGPGILTVEGCTFADYLATGSRELVLADGASVVYSAPNSSVNEGLAVTNVVGNPAFWVDVSQASSMTYAADDAGTLRVSRLNDVRGEGYPFATSEGTLSPELVTNENG